MDQLSLTNNETMNEAIINNETKNSMIMVLPPEVIDQIAAGEVVERPAHLVKELVENSIDAQATEIAVDFSNGGRFVKVTDNGIGISAEDLPKAFLRFATSKINSTDDIWRLSSFGFRGEALASISSVSRVTIFSSQTDTGEGYRLTSTFGKLSTLEPVSRSRGCTVIIEELFQNVPARLKFMKSDVAESSQIKNVLKAMALAHPQVDFRILHEGKLLYYWPRSTKKERVESILEIKPLYTGVASRGKIKAEAYFSDPHQVSRVSKNMWFFAQNRFIQDRSLQTAVMEAYRNLLMHGEYPYVVCFLETDPTEVDVNIHPTKSQVKFAQPSDAFRSVQAAIRDVLVKAPWLQSQQQVAPQTQAPNPLTAPFSAPTLAPTPTPYSTPTSYSTLSDDSETLSSSHPSNLWAEEKSHQQQIPSEASGAVRESFEFQSSLGESTSKFPSLTPTDIPTHLGHYWRLLKVIGQAGMTYLVCQNEKGLVLIDQHAAHERVAFERLMNSWKGSKIDIQQFLFPLPIELSDDKMEILRARQNDFLKLGIEMEELGPNTIGIKSGPAIIKNKVLVEEIERFVNQVIEHGDGNILEKAIADICARMACHSVMRAGQSLSLPEMQRLLEEMDEFPLSSFCPHGRPVSVQYTWTELEKDFGRRL